MPSRLLRPCLRMRESTVARQSRGQQRRTSSPAGPGWGDARGALSSEGNAAAGSENSGRARVLRVLLHKGGAALWILRCCNVSKALRKPTLAAARAPSLELLAATNCLSLHSAMASVRAVNSKLGSRGTNHRENCQSNGNPTSAQFGASWKTPPAQSAALIQLLFRTCTHTPRWQATW